MPPEDTRADIAPATAAALRRALAISARCNHTGVSDYLQRKCELYELRSLVGVIANQLEHRGQ